KYRSSKVLTGITLAKSNQEIFLMPAPQLSPGKNCWLLSQAEEAAVFLDAEEYYASLYDNLCMAQERIIFLGWDFDSRLNLIPARRQADGKHPSVFGRLLKSLARHNPSLDIRILSWDFATLYLPMRELFQQFKFNGISYPNIKFAF